MLKTVADVLEMGKHVEMVDMRFTDLLGMWHHFTLPARELSERLFEEGMGFDGSSIRAFQEIHESDMILVPDPTTAFVDPVLKVPTADLIWVVSAVRRDTSSPLWAVSKNDGDRDVRWLNTSRRRSATMRSPSVITR